MQKKSRRPREKVLSMALMLVMLVLGILCFLTPLSTLVGVQYLAFGCLAIYGAVMVVRYIGSEHKSKFLLLGGVACFLLSAAVLLVWMSVSYTHLDVYKRQANEDTIVEVTPEDNTVVVTPDGETIVATPGGEVTIEMCIRDRLPGADQDGGYPGREGSAVRRDL